MFMFIHSRAVAMRVTSLVFLIGIVFISFFFLKINFWLGSIFFVFFAGIAIWMWLLAATVTSKPLPDPAKWAGPNTIPLKTRIFNLLISVCLVAYASYSIANDDFYLPSKRGPGTHVHGLVVWIFVAACLAVVINMMSTVVDHFDKRNNELTYAHIDAATQWLGWIFFLIGLTSLFAFNSSNLGCEDREVHRVRNPDNALAAVTFVRYCENKSEPARSTQSIQVTVLGIEEKLPLLVDNESAIQMARSGVNRIFWAKQKLFVVYDAPENLSYKETKPSIGKKFTFPVELINSVNKTSYELDQLNK